MTGEGVCWLKTFFWEVEERIRAYAKSNVNFADVVQFIYLDWLAAQVGLAPTEEQLKKIYDKMIELIIISWVGFRELAILKTKISARLISRCFLASKFAIILDQTITVLVKSLVLFPSIPFYCSSIVFWGAFIYNSTKSTNFTM